MAKEIEKKFLLLNDEWKSYYKYSLDITQAYIASHNGISVRVRLSSPDRNDPYSSIVNKSYITIKGPTVGFTKDEFEYDIPYSDAITMLGYSDRIVHKIRYHVPSSLKNHDWEIDVFKDKNAGLVVAELEFDSEDQMIETPSWLGKEVTYDKKYRNSYLSKHPFTEW